MVRFLRGASTAFSALESKNAETIYFITDTNELYIGSDKISSHSELAAAIARIATNEGNITSIQNQLKTLTESGSGSIAKMIQDAVDEINETIGELSDLDTDAADIVTAINQVEDKADAAQAAADAASAKADVVKNESKVTVEKQATAETGFAHTYVIKQNGVQVGEKINLPKDIMLKSGSYNASTKEIILVLNNDSEIKVPASGLVDIYTASNASGARVEVTITDDKKVSADLSASVKASLALADSAVQTIATGTKNGSIKVDGTDVDVKGLGSAAYTESSAYDAAGTGESKANAALNSAKSYTDTEIGKLADLAKISKSTLISELDGRFDAKGAATTAETNAKSYVNGLLEWGTL